MPESLAFPTLGGAVLFFDGVPLPVPPRYRPLDHPWVDDDLAPIYRLTYPQSPDRDEVIARNEEIYDWYTKLEHPIAWVVDCTALVRADAQIRKLQSQHVARIEPYAGRWDAGDAFVIRSRVVRGYLTAVFWFSPPPYDYEIFSRIPAAMVWAQKKLVERASR